MAAEKQPSSSDDLTQRWENAIKAMNCDLANSIAIEAGDIKHTKRNLVPPGIIEVEE